MRPHIVVGIGGAGLRNDPSSRGREELGSGTPPAKCVGQRRTGKGGGNRSGKDGGNGKGGNGKDGAGGKGGGSGKGGKGPAGNLPTRITPPSGTRVNSSSGDLVQFSGTNIDVLHRNGMRERVKAGRYLMKDGRGRIIIERRATGADFARLRDMMD